MTRWRHLAHVDRLSEASGRTFSLVELGTVVSVVMTVLWLFLPNGNVLLARAQAAEGSYLLFAMRSDIAYNLAVHGELFALAQGPGNYVDNTSASPDGTITITYQAGHGVSTLIGGKRIHMRLRRHEDWSSQLLMWDCVVQGDGRGDVALAVLPRYCRSD